MDYKHSMSKNNKVRFFTGSIMAVTAADPYAPGKTSRFVGICIERHGQGLYANFTLRNVLDGQGWYLLLPVH